MPPASTPPERRASRRRSEVFRQLRRDLRRLGEITRLVVSLRTNMLPAKANLSRVIGAALAGDAASATLTANAHNSASGLRIDDRFPPSRRIREWSAKEGQRQKESHTGHTYQLFHFELLSNYTHSHRIRVLRAADSEPRNPASPCHRSEIFVTARPDEQFAENSPSFRSAPSSSGLSKVGSFRPGIFAPVYRDFPSDAGSVLIR